MVSLWTLPARAFLDGFGISIAIIGLREISDLTVPGTPLYLLRSSRPLMTKEGTFEKNVFARNFWTVRDIKIPSKICDHLVNRSPQPFLDGSLRNFACKSASALATNALRLRLASDRSFPQKSIPAPPGRGGRRGLFFYFCNEFGHLLRDPCTL